jgi:hypothetical protein
MRNWILWFLLVIQSLAWGEARHGQGFMESVVNSRFTENTNECEREIPIGNLQALDFKPGWHRDVFLTNNGGRIFSPRNGEFFDIAESRYGVDPQLEDVKLSQGDWIVKPRWSSSDEPNQYQLLNSKTGKKIEFKTRPGSSETLQLTPDGRHLVAFGFWEPKTITVIETATGRVLYKKSFEYELGLNSNFIKVADKDFKRTLIHIGTWKELSVLDADLVKEGNKAVTRQDYRNALILGDDPNRPKIIRNLYSGNYTAFDEQTAIHDFDFEKIHLETGEKAQIELPYPLDKSDYYIKEKGEGSWLLRNKNTSDLVVMDEDFKKVKFKIKNFQGRELKILPSGKGYVFTKDDKIFLFKNETLCLDDPIKIDGRIKSKINLNVCSAEATDQAIKELPETPPKAMSKNDAYLYLQKFAQVGGFKSPRDVPALISILDSNMAESLDNLFLSLVGLNVMSESTELHRYLTEKYLLFSQSFKPKDIKNTWRECLLDKQKKERETQIKKIFEKHKSMLHPERTDLGDWEPILPLSSFFALLSETEKEEMRDHMAQTMANKAADDPNFKGIFVSKLYKLAYQSIAPFFGETKPNTTDLSVAREGKKITPYIFGTQPLSDGTRSPYGFYYKTAQPITVDLGKISQEPIKQEIIWNHAGTRFTGEIDIKALPERTVDLAPEIKTIPYDKLLKDKKLYGVIMTGSSMGTSGPYVMKEYKSYFQDRGYRFEGPIPLRDTEEFLKSAISGVEGADYFVKEAHSDGDEKNIFKTDREAVLYRGQKEVNGIVEVVDLVFPAQTVTSTYHVSNRNFGEWIRTKKSPLVYFNTSCNSYQKAVYELEAAGTQDLVQIASATCVYPFENTPNSKENENTEYAMFESFLDQKNFQEMRDRMSKTPKQKNKEDIFIFPDDQKYTDLIRNNLRIPLDIQIKFKDSASGKAYNIDISHP